MAATINSIAWAEQLADKSTKELYAAHHRAKKLQLAELSEYIKALADWKYAQEKGNDVEKIDEAASRIQHFHNTAYDQGNDPEIMHLVLTSSKAK